MDILQHLSQEIINYYFRWVCCQICLVVRENKGNKTHGNQKHVLLSSYERTVFTFLIFSNWYRCLISFIFLHFWLLCNYDFCIINQSSLHYSYACFYFGALVVFLYQKENKERAFLGDMSQLERVGKGVGYWESHNVFLSMPAALFMKVCLDCPPLCEQFVQLNHILSLSY